MPNIFGGAAGRVVAVETHDNYLPLGLVVEDFKKQLGAKGLLTSLSGAAQSGFQVMHTLRQYIHVYTFGERAGELTVNGLAFMQDCTNATIGGLARLYDWYELNRISHRGSPLKLVVTPGVVFNGFLTGLRFQVEDPSISLIQFSLQFFHPPRIRPRGSKYAYSPSTLSGKLDLLGAGNINLTNVF